MVNRAVRHISSLQRSASTSRVLNLHGLSRRMLGDDAWRQRPMFRHGSLNRAIFIKHRLRANESELFDDGRAVATKILLPLDPTDLRSGGRYVFIGERGFDQVMETVFGDRVGGDRRDRRLLDLLDSIPSLDPFLLREFLRRNGFDAAPCYFDLSDADLKRIFGFVEAELMPLVRLSLRSDVFAGETERLVKKMLSATTDAELEPLRMTLRLAPEQFGEGVFCWKGFLYYKWSLQQVLADVPTVARQIASIQPRGVYQPAVRSYVDGARETVRAGIAQAADAAGQILQVYDSAFGELTSRGDPTAFRDFLLAAPARFMDLGDRLGAISHLVSFWTYRFPGNRQPMVTADELADIFLDFEMGLASHKRAFAVGW